MCYDFSWNIWGVEITGSYGNSMFNFLRKCQTPPQQLHHFTFPPETQEGTSCSASPPSTGDGPALAESSPRVVLTADCICTPLMVKDAELLMCLLDMCVSFFGKCLLSYFAKFSTGLPFDNSVGNVFYVFGIQIPYRVHDARVFPPILWAVSLSWEYHLQRKGSYFDVVQRISSFGTISKKPPPTSRSQRFTPIFSSQCFHSFSSDM